MQTDRHGESARPSWVAGRWASALWRGLREGCRGVPKRAWAWWGLMLVIGWVVCVAVSVIGTRLAKANVERGLQAWDERGLRWVERHGPLKFPDAILVESPGNLAYLIPLTVLASVLAIGRGKVLIAISVQVAYWGVRPIVLAGWWTWNRARPTLIGDGIAAPGLHSFPSGHAALTTAVYGLLIFLWIRQSRSVLERVVGVVLLLAIVGFVSLARVRLGSHWPSDVMAGAVLGALWLATVILALRGAEKRAAADTGLASGS